MDNMISTLDLSQARHPTARYFGQDPGGCFRVKRKDGRFLVAGKLYELGQTANMTDSGRIVPKLVATTPQNSSKVDRSKVTVQIVESVKLGKTYAVVGIFRPYLPESSVNAAANETRPSSVGGPSQASKGVAGCRKKRKSEEVLIEQIRTLVAQRDAGLDPDLRMAHLPLYLQESKASLYRKMGSDFPAPVKRGRASFWPMSKIDAYKAGKILAGDCKSA